MTTLKVSRWPFFLMGIIFYAALDMAHQDWLGLDGYLDAVRAGWVETTVWSDLAIAALAFGGMLIPFRAVSRSFTPCVACAVVANLEARHGLDDVLHQIKRSDPEMYQDIHDGVRDIVDAASDLGIV